MKRSSNRILTTHAGRLDGPPDFRAKMGRILSGKSPDLESLKPQVRTSMTEIVRLQSEAGIDVISDGELGKLGFGFAYYGRRLSGLGVRPLKAGESGWMGHNSGERAEFADFYKELGFMPEPMERSICNAPITYIGQAEVQSDIETFKSALAASGAKPEEAFMCVLAPGWIEHFFHNEYYKTDEDYLFALADAMKQEYKAIVDAGFILQLDDPALPDTYDMIVPRPTVEEYRKFAAVRVDALNHALTGLPEDRVRFHCCWGSWHGPHTSDLPLKHIVDLMLKIKAGAYSVEAANPRHEHEWRVWRDVKLPEGKILIPGVVSHASNVVEHPELVADRIVLYAGLVGRENVIAGTDCGLGLRVHPQIAWAKLKTLAEGAEMASKQLWGAKAGL
ncbi:MAG: cobalamin-independent methionine synthase II family protein [Bryobacterales bacterium]|nr:cobalamin-independent methionine synthase II family protein [Bryobacterales bacterium]MBV9400905.1 cobalamin-independent methionine synthase II family protein [Bryobacterales bacterium]